MLVISKGQPGSEPASCLSGWSVASSSGRPASPPMQCAVSQLIGRLVGGFGSHTGNALSQGQMHWNIEKRVTTTRRHYNNIERCTVDFTVVTSAGRALWNMQHANEAETKKIKVVHQQNAITHTCTRKLRQWIRHNARVCLYVHTYACM